MLPLRAQVRLADESDRAAFRAWFTFLADAQYYRAAPEVTDCAALVRHAYREALRAHTPEWVRRVGLPLTPAYPDLRRPPRPGAAGWPLFRVTDRPDGAYGEFADARTIVRLNAQPIGRTVRALRPGDLIFFHQPDQTQPDHLMIFVGASLFEPGASDWVVYHTGPSATERGEIRKVRLADLLRHPAPRWRPRPANPNFIGIFRLTVL